MVEFCGFFKLLQYTLGKPIHLHPTADQRMTHVLHINTPFTLVYILPTIWDASHSMKILFLKSLKKKSLNKNILQKILKTEGKILLM